MKKFSFVKIVSGGQTGVDRAALDIALEFDIPCGGWCPRGRGAEDGTIAEKYRLQETPSDDVDQRTEWNVRDSDGTLLISVGTPTDGTPWTEECARRYSKPIYSIDLTVEPNAAEFKDWLLKNSVKVLNIAGPRESQAPGVIYAGAQRVLWKLLEL